MTTRRVFLGGALVAASAAVAPRFAFAQGQARTAKIRAKDGTELFVKDTGGTGRAVVLTHAWPLNADIWDYQAAELSKAGFRAVTYDRRGFGRSGQPAGGYNFDVFADDLAAVIEQTGLRDVTIVGYSMGGGEVVRYFSRHNGRNVVKAGLVGGAAYYLLKTANNPIGAEMAVFDGMRQGVQNDRKVFLTGLFANVFFDAKRSSTTPVTQEVLDSALAMAMQASVSATLGCVEAFSTTDFRSELASVNVPTLLLHGTADIPVSFELGKATAAGIAQSQLIAYEGGSHGIVVSERDRVTKDLHMFLASCDQGYRGASVEQIAARLNLTKGSFYHHYSSKEELVAACFERTFDVIRHMQMLSMERMDSGWERLSAAARVLVRFQISEQGPLVRTTAWNALPPELRTDSQRRFDRLTEKFSIFIVEGMLEGTIPPLDSGIAAQQVAGMINAASELERWVPGIAHEDGVRLFAQPLFEGILSSGAGGAAPTSRS